jgi:hypothetical protein
LKFTQDDIDKIGAIIGASESGWEVDHFRLKVVQQEEQRTLVLEIYPDTELGRERGALVVVYTGATHLQLHNCSGYVTSEELAEVTFVAESEDKISGLVVEREAACSLYAEINRDLISSDFSTLGVEVMLSGVALSLAEDVFNEEDEKKE